MKSKVLWLAVVLAFALVAAACSSDDEGGEETTTTAAETTTTAAETTTTTTTRAPAPDFEGKVLDAGGCDYGGKVEKITAVDEFTVEFDLCAPDPAFLAKIAFSVFGIQPEEHLEATGGAPLRNPVGTGPYSLVEWVAGDSVVYERNDAYYGDPAPHQTAVLRWATEGAQRLLELQSGNVDGITFPSTDDYPVIEGDPNLALVNKPEPNILYVAMTNTFAPFDDPNVRKAMAVGIDRQRLVDTFYPAGSEVATHFTPCSVQHGCEGEAWYDFDVDAAKAFLAEAGLADGFDTTIYYRDVFRGYLPEPGAVAVDLQTQLKDNLNINAEIVVMESGAFIEESQAGNLEGIYLLGWTGDYPHITNFLDFHFTANNPQFGVNDPSYTEPLLEASKLSDPVAAAPLYAEANTAIKEFVPMVPIVHSTTAFAFSAAVDGAYAPPWGQVLFHNMDNGEDTFVFMQGNEPISLYCADESDGESLRGCNQVVEALYGYDQTGNVQPQLATECTPNDDLSVWTCSLRQGVVFHDGTTFDSNDVVVSWTAGLDAASPIHVGNTGAWTYYDYLWDGLINAEG
jgi:ABC-type transport system substrate-binding protein